MIVVNKSHIILVLGIVVIILSINIEKCASVGSNGVIREENFVSRKLKQEKDILLKDGDLFKDLKFDPEPSGASPINPNPSLINKQSNPPVQDPIIDAKIDQLKQQNDYLFIFVVAGCTIAGVIALLAAGVCWYTVFRAKAVDPNYGTKSGKLSPSGSVKSNSTSSGDRRLAQSAQMYHYQHQKQQMIAMEKANSDTKPENSDNSEGETEEGDYTVYECPGLAPTGEMEVKNPLFKEDFSASSQNIYQSTLPPSYSTLGQPVVESVKTEQLIEIEETKDDLNNTNKNNVEPKPVDSVSIPINDTNPTSQN